MQANGVVEGRVIRVGRGWADVMVGRKMRRVTLRADVLVRPGNTLRVIGDHGIASLPTGASSPTARIH